ncbi:MAG: hypothetical protein ACHREM_25025 [Polyangiales bacterium]
MSLQHNNSKFLSSILLASLASAALAGCDVGFDLSLPDSAPVVTDGAHADEPLRCDAGTPGSAPIAPDAGAPSNRQSRWFVIGNVNPGRSADGSLKCGWTSVALDLDHRATDPYEPASATASCARASGAPSNTLLDGVGGVDDNFVEQVLPVINGLDYCFDSSMSSGDAAMLLRLDAAANDDATQVGGAVFLAHRDPSALDGGASQAWRVDARSLADGATLSRPIATFSAGYVRDGVWVSGEATGRAMLPLMIQPSFWKCDPTSPLSEADLPIARTQLVVHLNPVDGSQSIVAGVMPSAELAAALIPSLIGDVCLSDSLRQSAIETFSQAADTVLAAPDLNDPSVTCDSISLGLGFTIQAIDAPTAVVPAPVIATPAGCGDAGAD